MSIATRLAGAFALLRASGPTKLAKYSMHRFVESRYERRFGISTGAEVKLESLGIHDSDLVEYAPSPYPAFFGAMRRVRVDLRSSTFVDYGCGKGRIVVCAATFPFKEVIGIELAPQLAEEAARNLRTALPHARAASTRVMVQNACEFPVPETANVLHFYNPFRGETLRTVIGNIRDSLHDHPRQLWVLFGNPWFMDKIMKAGDILPVEWLKGAVDLPWPFHDHGDVNGNRYRIYQWDSRR